MSIVSQQHWGKTTNERRFINAIRTGAAHKYGNQEQQKIHKDSEGDYYECPYCSETLLPGEVEGKSGYKYDLLLWSGHNVPVNLKCMACHKIKLTPERRTKYIKTNET